MAEGGHSSRESRIGVGGSRMRASGSRSFGRLGLNDISNAPLDDLAGVDSSDSDYGEEEDGVITIYDDDEQNADPDKDKPMVCFRCPNRSQGTFTDVEKFRIHCKRHIFGDHFCCLTCGRPFTQINFCISHEIRVHDSKIDYDNNDKVIKYAKKYREQKRVKKAQRALAREQRGLAGSVDEESGNETDPEHPKFYNNLVVSSTTLYGYRGPKVKHIVEAYAIQLKFARPRFQRATQTARLALQSYGNSVRDKIIPNYVAEDTELKAVRGLLTNNGYCGPARGNARKAKAKAKPPTKRPSSTAKSSIARAKNAKTNNRVRIISPDPSSSEDNSDTEDSDYQPPEKDVENGAANRSRK
ncbi:hypothetical protein Ocin01_12550 [Orchesella cincta]|uniref:C2H2-type domain-containing protein n=1 Tax=Orchesella cincta TaxID=48709 RepID=A0A1D2MMQ6_ORCCI|nr:hypothetical protein Ocin01_12550 [Orchesella cincta]